MTGFEKEHGSGLEGPSAKGDSGFKGSISSVGGKGLYREYKNLAEKRKNLSPAWQEIEIL